jgi:hypothetical protein
VRAEEMSLSKQVEVVFKEIEEELSHLSSGIVFLQIRNNVVGKFGIKHFPLESKDGSIANSGEGLTPEHVRSFRAIAVDSLSYKKRWTHGEIYFEFAVKKGHLIASIQFESNYNMANLFMRKDPVRRERKELY